MCKNCKVVEELFRAASSNPHENYIPVYRLLEELIKQKRLKVYAGDCSFEDVLEVLSSEKHYTVSFYLECTQCGDIFFYGACIRGKPVYKKVENVNKEKIDALLWGREGLYFRQY